MKLIDLTGKRYGRWVVIERHGDVMPARWLCRCDCGTVRDVKGDHLKSGQSKSCRCIGAERFKNLKFSGDKNPMRVAAMAKHGKLLPPGDPWYKRACRIKKRCQQSGIEFGFPSATTCAIYLMSISSKECPVFGFEFVEGKGAFSKMAPSVDRIDSSKGYLPGNLQIISMMANAMKADATAEELKLFAKWIITGGSHGNI